MSDGGVMVGEFVCMYVCAVQVCHFGSVNDMCTGCKIYLMFMRMLSN